jgi:hypothetical protein
MYSIPPGTLPITGADLMGFGIAGGALVIAGIVTLRLAFSLRRRRAAEAAALAPGDSGT